MGSQRVGHDWVTELNWPPDKCNPCQDFVCNTSYFVSFTSFFYRFYLLVCSLSFIWIVCPSNSVPANINISYLVLEEILQMILSYSLIFTQELRCTTWILLSFCMELVVKPRFLFADFFLICCKESSFSSVLVAEKSWVYHLGFNLHLIVFSHHLFPFFTTWTDLVSFK